jgi:hypothetical protein
MKKHFSRFLVSLMVFIGQIIIAQNSKVITFHFVPLMNHEPLELGKKYAIDSEKLPVTINLFKCYVSHIVFYNDKELVYDATNEAFLLDCSEKNSLTRTITLPGDINYTELRFYFGLDDQTNDKGISGGDLDPTKGMYWTWQTGYINMKMEGTSLSSGAADHNFQFHLGGFLAPFASFQPLTITTENKSELAIAIELADFIKKINFAETHTLMSPCQQSVLLSKYAASMFHLL